MLRLMICLSLIVSMAATGCQKGVKTKQGRGDASGQDANLDESRYGSLAAGKEHEGDRAEEARAWLDPKRTENALWKTSRQQTLQYVNDLYAAGAVKVYAVYMPKDGTVRINLCAELFLELPANKEKRKAVMKQFNKIEKGIWGEDAEKAKEEGQKYLSLNMDP